MTIKRVARRASAWLAGATSGALVIAQPVWPQSAEQAPSRVPHAMRLLPEDLSQKPFQFGEGVQVTAGPLAEGSVLLTGPLLYAYQARSTEPFFIKDGWGPMNFPSGMNFYGVPLGDQSGNGLHGLAWCSPDSDTKLVFASCVVLLEGKPISATTQRDNPYLATGVLANLQGTTSSRIAIEPVSSRHDLFAGVATVEVRVSGWSASRLSVVTNVVVQGRVVSTFKRKIRLKNSTATLGFGNGAIRLRGTDGSGFAEIITPVGRADSIMPTVAP